MRKGELNNNRRYTSEIPLFLFMNNFTGLIYNVQKIRGLYVNDNLLEAIKKCQFNGGSLSSKIGGLNIEKLS